MRRIPWLTLGVIAVGGVIGALARRGPWGAFPQAHAYLSLLATRPATPLMPFQQVRAPG